MIQPEFGNLNLESDAMLIEMKRRIGQKINSGKNIKLNDERILAQLYFNHEN